MPLATARINRAVKSSTDVHHGLDRHEAKKMSAVEVSG